jgi:hypothetical protein
MTRPYGTPGILVHLHVLVDANNIFSTSSSPSQPPRKPLQQRENLPHLFQDTGPAWLHGYLPAAPLVCGEEESWITTSAPHAGEFQLANWPAGGSILPAADLALQFPSTLLLDTLGALGLRDMIDAEYASLLSHTFACSALNSVDWEASKEQDVKLSVVDGELLNNSIDATDSVRERLWAEIEDILRLVSLSFPANFYSRGRVVIYRRATLRPWPSMTLRLDTMRSERTLSQTTLIFCSLRFPSTWRVCEPVRMQISLGELRTYFPTRS